MCSRIIHPHALPPTVDDFLRNHGPDGTLIAHWIDRQLDFNVLVLCERDGMPWFDARAFPQQVDHWDRQVMGDRYSVDEMTVLLAHGLWDADGASVERVRQVLGCLNASPPPATRPS